MSTVGIVGGGVLGRLAALALNSEGWKVSLFEREEENARSSCSFVAAGMLAPGCELETAPRFIAELGWRSLALWPRWLAVLEQPVFFQSAGSLVVSHARDRGGLAKLRGQLADVKADDWEVVDRPRLHALEPELTDRFAEGIYFPREGQLEPRDFLTAAIAALKTRGVEIHFGTSAEPLPGQVRWRDGKQGFDWVIDCRGLAGKAHWQTLRGVRGERLRVEAPEVALRRPIRLMHPRYPLYVVPRPHGQFIVGASVIDSEDYSPISVRTTLELLSAAFSLHPGFAEARILETATQCRPALPGGIPRIAKRPGLLRVNGLFRHGYLVSPAIVEAICAYLNNERIEEFFSNLWEEAA